MRGLVTAAGHHCTQHCTQHCPLVLDGGAASLPPTPTPASDAAMTDVDTDLAAFRQLMLGANKGRRNAPGAEAANACGPLGSTPLITACEFWYNSHTRHNASHCHLLPPCLHLIRPSTTDWCTCAPHRHSRFGRSTGHSPAHTMESRRQQRGQAVR